MCGDIKKLIQTTSIKSQKVREKDRPKLRKLRSVKDSALERYLNEKYDLR